MGEVNSYVALTIFIAGIIVIAVGILLIKLGKKVDNNGKRNIAQLIVGWSLIVLTIVGLMVGLILL